MLPGQMPPEKDRTGDEEIADIDIPDFVKKVHECGGDALQPTCVQTAFERRSDNLVKTGLSSLRPTKTLCRGTEGDLYKIQGILA